MTDSDEELDIDIDISAEGRAIAKALKSMIAKAKKAGVKRPGIYFENAGCVHIMDLDVLDCMGDRVTLGGSKAASVGNVNVGGFDVGALVAV